MFCKFHKQRLAHDYCTMCKAPICSDCYRVMSGQVYCSKCLPKSQKRAKKYLPRNPALAAALGIFPGLGQVYNGQTWKGVFIFFTSWLVIPWFFGIYDAYATAYAVNNHDLESNPAPALFAGCLVLVVIFLGFFLGGPLLLIKGFPSFCNNVLFENSEKVVKTELSEISGAIKAYHKDYGKYPENENDLYFGDIVYLHDMYCGMKKSHYLFQCKFDADGYEIQVLPLKEGLPAYRMTPGPIVEKFSQ